MKPLHALFTALVCLNTVSISVAQKPEPVHSITRQEKPFEWYEQQAKAWKLEIDRGNAQPMAWVYWNEANRIVHRFFDKTLWENKQESYFISEKDLMERAEKAIPGSFEWYYIAMRNEQSSGFYGALTQEYLFKAQALKPYDPLILPNLMCVYLLQNDKPAFDQVGKKWYELREIPSDILSTAYNMLIALEPNAILLTYGDNDSYPLWVLQQAKGLRSDVLVLNLSLLRGIPSYQKRVFQDLGIHRTDSFSATLDTYPSVFNALVTNVTNRPIYVSAFAAQDVYQQYQKNMYPLGLTLKYSVKPFNNLEVMRKDVEQKFVLDFLKISFSDDKSQDVSNKMNKAYITIFSKLSDYYKNSLKNPSKAAEMLDKANDIAKNTGDANWLNMLNK